MDVVASNLSYLLLYCYLANAERSVKVRFAEDSACYQMARLGSGDTFNLSDKFLKNNI